jgi:hypothetical protein
VEEPGIKYGRLEKAFGNFEGSHRAVEPMIVMMMMMIMVVNK